VATRRRDDRPTADRKIYFFRANVGNDEGGAPLQFDPRPALRRVKGLPFTPEGRYLEIQDGQALCCWPVAIASESKLLLGTIRRHGFPQIEKAGAFRALRVPVAAGLVEPIQVMFFRRNIVGCVFNFYGPRMSRLAEYFAEKADGQAKQVQFDPLLRQDVLDQLDRLADVRLLQLKIRRPFVETVRRAERSLGDAFAAAQEAGSADEVEIILKMAGRRGQSLADRLRSGIARLARNARTRQEAQKFVVRGFDEELGHVETIDVLKDQFIAESAIVRVNERSRALDRDSAFEAIAKAHAELRDQLESAASVALNEE